MGRHTGIIALLALAAATACSSTPPTITPGPPTEDPLATETATALAEPLTVEVLNTEVAVAFERVTFRILDRNGLPISTSTEVEGVFHRVAELSPEQQLAQRVASGNAFYFGADMPSGGTWVVYSEFNASGTWWLEVFAKRGDWTGNGRGALEVVARSGMPVAGDRAPETDTPSAAAGLALDALTSDEQPLADLYAQPLADVLAAGRPAVVLFASPAHCEDPACAVTLGQFKTAHANMGSRAAFLHVESRDLDDPAALSATARAWGLEGEPWTFVVDGRGFVSARVQGELSASELQLLLDTLLR